MNPDFLREGTAVQDFLKPDKIFLGADNDRALADMHDIFQPLISKTDTPVVETDTWTAEMIKYANNRFSPRMSHSSTLSGKFVRNQVSASMSSPTLSVSTTELANSSSIVVSAGADPQKGS
jgi:hypothetical protein